MGDSSSGSPSAASSQLGEWLDQHGQLGMIGSSGSGDSHCIPSSSKERDWELFQSSSATHLPACYPDFGVGTSGGAPGGSTWVEWSVAELKDKPGGWSSLSPAAQSWGCHSGGVWWSVHQGVDGLSNPLPRASGLREEVSNDVWRELLHRVSCWGSGFFHGCLQSSHRESGGETLFLPLPKLRVQLVHSRASTISCAHLGSFQPHHLPIHT